MRTIATLVGCVLVAGCVSQPASDALSVEVRGVPMDLTSVEITAIQDRVRSTLKDPDSAHCGPIGATLAPDGIITVCGLVNAKNGYGGYSGTQPYMAFLNRRGMPVRPVFVLGDVGGDTRKQETNRAICERRGIVI